MRVPAAEQVDGAPASERTRIAGFRLLRRRSKGAIGALYLADNEKGEPTLVRLISQDLDAKARERVKEDLGVLEDVVNPNVVRLLSHSQDEGQSYYVLDDPGGASLLDLVRTCRPLDESELAWIGRGLARGLAALHRVHLPHGNLVPANVDVTPQGPQIVDVGWGPRLKGRGPDAVGDLRSLGELLAFAASGVRPPPPDKPFDLRKRIPWLSLPVAHLLEALLGPAADRPTAKEAAKEFEELAASLQVPASAPLPSIEALLAKLPDTTRGRSTSGGSGSGSGLMESSWELEGTPSLRQGSAILLRPGLELVVERLLGQGGMGVVYLLRDPQLARLAALKLVRGKNETRIRRFLRETSVTARLDHPGIPPVYEAGRTPGGDDYLLMRYVEGSSLRQLLDRRERKGGSRNPDEVRNLLGALVKVGEALGYAHSRGIVHRDLKPDNIMVGAHGEVFVMDWGLARNLGESAQEDAMVASDFATVVDTRGKKLTHDGAFLGTPGYVAPEQFRREEVDGRADVFALGAVLSEVLTGRPPFASDDTIEILTSTNEGRVVLPSERDGKTPPELNAIVAKALAADKAYRYTSAEALVSDLRAYLEGREVSVYQRSTTTQFLLLLRRHYIFFAFQGVVLLTLVAAGLFVTEANTRAIADQEQREKEDLRRKSEAQAEEARRRVEINGLVAAGKKALADDDADLAKEFFVKALARDPEHLEAISGKRETEARMKEAKSAGLVQRDQEEAKRLVAQGEGLEKKGDWVAARRAFVQALGYDGSNEAAQTGLIDVDRQAREEKEAKVKAARDDRAKKLLRRAEKSIAECHELIRHQEDPRKVQNGYLSAMNDLERALRLVSNFPAAEALRITAAQELYTVLKTEGQAELADFVLRTKGVDKPAPGVIELELDPHLVVEETDSVLVRRAFAGAVHFLPTAAFDPLRDYLERLGKGRFRAFVGVRSQVTDSIPPNVLATGLWIRLEDRKTRSITPTLKIEFERPFRRGIRLDQHRRLVAPFDLSSPRDAKRYVAQVEAEIKRMVQSAVNRKG